jgi:hypothetical protein
VTVRVRKGQALWRVGAKQEGSWVGVWGCFPANQKTSVFLLGPKFWLLKWSGKSIRPLSFL